MTQPLPPALIRLASALELSSGFLLYFLTGPRDHVDSVYLRLRALTPDFELVRHRIRSAADLDLSDLLATTRDDRPRIVFLSGLETLPTALRRELTERLNLLRDSWAPHPARVVFWLPSWGLGEFRRIAPDLFDWRSGLITLSDADLPIRSELEYLVWACERHGGGPLRSAELALGVMVTSVLNQPPHRLVISALDPGERIHILRPLTASLATRAAITRSDDGDDELGGPRRSPVLVRSQDAAGILDGDAPWHALARAAGVPGPDSAAVVLASLAARGRLLVLLDGFDRLRLAEGDAPRRWLEQLMATTPPIPMLATITAAPCDFFATWPHFPVTDRIDSDPEDTLSRQHRELITLMKVLFPASKDLSTLASYLLGPEADDLQLHGPPEVIATRLILACARRGLLDASFFAELTRMRPAHAAEIETIARSLIAP